MIRNMQTRDSQRVMQLWLNGNLQAHNFIPAKFWESNAPSVYEQLLQADGYVYEADGEILGFAGMQGNYLAGIFVDVRSRSLGIGKKQVSRLFSACLPGESPRGGLLSEGGAFHCFGRHGRGDRRAGFCNDMGMTGMLSGAGKIYAV